MKILILGGKGMLGHKLVQVLSQNKLFDVWMTINNDFNELVDNLIFDKNKTYENINILKFLELEKLVFELKPDVIINAIGIIKQKAISDQIAEMLEINSVFPHKMAEISQRINSRFITFSTDCVFDGKQGNYTEDDFPNAKDLYGKSKNLGEVLNDNCLTFRTSIVGRELNSSKSLIEWFISQKEKSVKGYSKAIYTGFPTIVMAEIIKKIILDYPQMQGLWHLSSEPISKYELLKLVNQKLNLNICIDEDKEFMMDRSLDSNKFRSYTSFQLESWDKMIDKMFDDPTPYQKIRKLNNL